MAATAQHGEIVMASSHQRNHRRTILDEFMNALAREYGRLNPGDPRRTEIAEQISELSLLAAELEKPDIIQ